MAQGHIPVRYDKLPDAGSRGFSRPSPRPKVTFEAWQSVTLFLCRGENLGSKGSNYISGLRSLAKGSLSEPVGSPLHLSASTCSGCHPFPKGPYTRAAPCLGRLGSLAQVPTVPRGTGEMSLPSTRRHTDSPLTGTVPPFSQAWS